MENKLAFGIICFLAILVVICISLLINCWWKKIGRKWCDKNFRRNKVHFETDEHGNFIADRAHAHTT